MNSAARYIPFVVAATIALTACGGEGDSDSGTGRVTPEKRIQMCLSEQPEATKAECTEWEEDGQLGDDGSHQGHDEMDG